MLSGSIVLFSTFLFVIVCHIGDTVRLSGGRKVNEKSQVKVKKKHFFVNLILRRD